MDPQRVNLALHVLDDQLTDVEDDRFGRVDDIELTAGPGEPAEVAALLVGPGAWRWRVPRRFARLMSGLTPNVIRRLPWDLVDAFGVGEIHLRKPMREMGIGTDVSINAAWLGELERESVRLSAVLGQAVSDGDGRPLGRVYDVRATLGGLPSDPGRLEIRGVLVGRPGLAQRLLGARPEPVEPSGDAGFLEWARLEATPEGLVAR
jgi:hypothetical protein